MVNPNNDDELIHSYLTLRRSLALLALALPILLIALGSLIEDELTIRTTISAYWHAGSQGWHLETRDVFVGALFALGAFLIAYRGYKDAAFSILGFEVKDDYIGRIAGISAILVALFRTGGGWEGWIHNIAANVLFVSLALLCYVFTKSKGNMTPEKKIRNRIYWACAILIAVSLVLIYIYNLAFEDTALADIKPHFWLEALALWFFGIATLVKGEVIWTDHGIMPWFSTAWLVRLVGRA